MSSTNNLTIAGISIKQDSEGRFCLNDCHRASGGNESKRPSNWIRTQSTQDLIEEVKVSSNMSVPVKIVKTGLNEGRDIYASKEIVYAYAMWINPLFHLKVIHAYDALINHNFTIPKSYPEALRLAAQQAEEIKQLEKKGQALDRISKSDGFINSREIRSYEIAMTIDEPTQPGDYFRASFGNFADSKAEVLITDATILVRNSFLPIKRIVLSGILKIGASKSGDLPTLSLNENFIQIPPDQISFDTDSKSIVITAPKYFKAANNTRSGVICGRSEICGDPNNGDFAKYQAYSGGLNRTEGTAKLWVVDRTTNTLVDFKALVNPNPIYMQIQYELS